MYLRLLTILLIAFLLPEGSQGQIVRPQELSLQYHRAERAFRTGSSLNEAKTRLDTVIRALPEDVEALMLRSQVLLALGRPEDAARDAQSAVALQPANGEAWLLLCETRRSAGAVAEAVTALERAGSLIDSGADLHIRLSYNAQMLGDLDQAEAFGRLALTQDRSPAGANVQLARVFQAKSRPDAAAVTLAGGLEKGILTARDVTADPELSSLRSRPELQRWFQN
ncbi:MAG: tetratricopeptide repeat protein [Rhodothermales bacterium]|nr:tetratricopeptide repeat protein [Rhodothermales bacterium]